MSISKSTIIKYSTTIVTGLVIAFAVAKDRGLFEAADSKTAAMYVSDSFFVPAVLLIGLGLIVWVSTTGFFDIFGYAVRSVLKRFTSPGKTDTNGTYYDYVMERSEKRGKTQFFMCFCGLGFLVVAIIAYIVYSRL